MLKKMMTLMAITLMFSFVGCGKDSPENNEVSCCPEHAMPADPAEPVAEPAAEPVEVAEPAKDDADVQEPTEVAKQPDTSIADDSEAVAQPAQEAPAGMILFTPEIPSPAFRGTPRDSVVENLDPTPVTPPQFYAPEGTKNLALNKPVSASEEYCSVGEISMLNDGDKSSTDESYFEMAPGLQWVQIDLGAEHEIYAILFWNFLMEARVYNDTIVQISNDEDFIDAITLFNNDHNNSASELGLGAGSDKNFYGTNNGKLVDAKGQKARFVRIYTNGNNNSAFNHWVEVEVYGI